MDDFELPHLRTTPPLIFKKYNFCDITVHNWWFRILFVVYSVKIRKLRKTHVSENSENVHQIFPIHFVFDTHYMSTLSKIMTILLWFIHSELNPNTEATFKRQACTKGYFNLRFAKLGVDRSTFEIKIAELYVQILEKWHLNYTCQGIDNQRPEGGILWLPIADRGGSEKERGFLKHKLP